MTLHQAAQKAVARICHTLMTGLAHNDAIAALNELAALQQQPEPVAVWQSCATHDVGGTKWIDCSEENARAAEQYGFPFRVLYTVPPALQEVPSDVVIPPAPPECETEDEKTAFAFGYWQGLHAARKRQEVPREPVAWRYRYSPKQDWKLTSQPTTQWAADHSGFEEEPLYASPSTTQQPSVAAHALNTTPVVDHATQQKEAKPLTDVEALSIHSMSYVRDCLLRYGLSGITCGKRHGDVS